MLNFDTLVTCLKFKLQGFLVQFDISSNGVFCLPGLRTKALAGGKIFLLACDAKGTPAMSWLHGEDLPVPTCF